MAKKDNKTKAASAVEIVMLRNNWPGNFRRAGMEFKPGVPEGLDDKQFKAVQKDIGHALVRVELDEIGRPRVIEDLPEEAVAADPTNAEQDKSEGAGAASGSAGETTTDAK